MRRETKTKLILLAVSVVLSIAIAEIGLAIFYPRATVSRLRSRSVGMFLPSEILPYRLRPNARGRHTTDEFNVEVHINAQGHRGPDFDLDKRDAYRILVVGDSFTFGWGVGNHETFSARLQERLGASPSERRIEVVNAGWASCYYPDTYYLYLKRIGLDIDPDLVIVGFFIGNDVDHDKVRENVWTATDENGLPTKIESPHVEIENGYRVLKVRPRRYRYPVLRNSHLFQAIADLNRSMRTKRGMYFNHWIYRDHYEDRTIEAVDNVQRLFLAMADLTADKDAELLVVMIPAREQLHPEEYPFADYPFMQDLDLEKPQRVFAEFFSSSGIRYLDLLPAMKTERRERDLYFPIDGHWNRHGHEVAADRIAEALVEGGYWR